MNREQAKIRCKLSKEEWGALGEKGYAKWYEVMEHFGNGGDVDYLSGCYWVSTSKPSFDYCVQYRIRTKPHIVNGFEVPAPIEKYTGQDIVYVPCFHTQGWYISLGYEATCAATRAVERRAAFETPEAAKANSLAMAGIDPRTYKEQSE